MATFTLTANAEIVSGGAADDTVIGTTTTLNAGDRLTGGAGTDTLALYGSGVFRVDQLWTFTGFETITLNNDFASLYLGNQSVAVTGYVSGTEQVYLGSGAVTFQGGGGYNYVYSTSALNWNTGNSIDGGSYGTISLNSSYSDGAVYDLTTNTLSHINYLYGYGNNLTVTVNSAVSGGVANFVSYGTNSKLVTSDAALDLSHSTMSGFTVASSNTTGTNFTVDDIGTAFQITGGSGSDTITAHGSAFSAEQRNYIFATASVERIIDASGTYAAPPQNPNVFLTTTADTVTGTTDNDTVYGTAATLNAGDSLTGGAGFDTLALFGSGTFRVDQLATFSGFESITLNNFSSAKTELYLGSQSIAVTGYGSAMEQVYLGSGAVTFQGGGGYNEVYSTSASDWNAGNSIDGGSFGDLILNSLGPDTATYDLTTNTLSHINNLSGHGNNLTVKINSAVAAGVTEFGGHGKLVTSDAALDLSHSTVSAFKVASTNVTGTNFTVQDFRTAYQIEGGSEIDTITAQGFTFSADMRNEIFVNAASVEKIADASGTYTPDFVTITSNGGGNTAALSVAENTTAVTTVTATGPDGGQGSLHYFIIGGTDSGKFTIDSSTGALSFVTAPNFELPTDAGANNIYDVIVQVFYSFGGTDTQAIAVTVTDVFENAPTITLNGGGNTAALSVAENTTAVTTVTATPDGGQGSLQYSIIGGADSAKFTIDSNTGELRFITPPNFEVPTDMGGNNIYDVTVQVSDGHGDTDTQAVAVTVTNANEAPTLTSNGGGATASVSVAENSTAVTTVTASDPDAGQTLSYSISGADASKFTIDSNTGELRFITPPNFEVPTDMGGNNIYDVTVRASDGHGGTDTQAIAVTVTNANEAPTITSNGGGAPASVSVAENSTAVTTVTASDPDAGQTLSYSISGADASKFTIGFNTGELRFITPPNFEVPTDMGGNNIYDVTVQVSDGHGGTDAQAIAVTVTDANEAPTLTSNGGGATASVSVAENSTAVATATASDPDAGQTLSYSISGADASKFTINAGTGALSFIKAPNFEAPTDAGHDNVYDVTVRVLDGHGGIDAQALSVSVQNAADGNADILWQNTVVGTPTLWLMDGLSPTTGAVLPNPGPAWHVIDAGDFNGDGNADIVWQGSDGTPAMWLMDDDKPVWVGAVGPFNPGPSWQIKGTGDFNGDGNADIVWQGSDGTPAVWMMDGTNVEWVGAVGPFNPGPNWQIKDTGDFNGDGRSDILWQGSDGTAAVWLMDGTHVDRLGAVGPFNPGPSWQIKGTGDFDGNGRSDILWQNSDGTPAIWLMDGTNVVSLGVAGSFNPGPSWEIKGTDDFNGDGKSDILWQGSDGTPAIWLMDGLSATNVAALPNLGSDWHIIA